MRITPLDIQQKQFPVKMRGFDMEEVASFLEIVREEMEELLRENAEMKERQAHYEGQIEEYRSLERMLQESVLTTQQMVEDYKSNAKKHADRTVEEARKRAELTIKEAELKAEEIVSEAQQKWLEIRKDILNVKNIRRHYKEELRQFIESHLRMLDYDYKADTAAPPVPDSHPAIQQGDEDA